MGIALALSAAQLPDGNRYLAEPAFRRAALLASLPTPQNGYAALRLAHYATGDRNDWERRPEWNPASEPIAPGEEAARPLGAGAGPLVISAAALAGEAEALRALGEAAFFRYPTQLAPYAARIAGSPAALARYGFWSDSQRAGGLVRVQLKNGTTGTALTCATCHVRAAKGELVIGPGNDSFDLGALLHDADERLPPARRQTAASWGPGRVDVTTLVGDEPVRIPDLRPVRFLTHLQHTASVVHRDVSSLAVRLETLIIVSHGEAVRPPRAVALALAVYIYSLAEQLPQRAPSTPAERHGSKLFAAHCARCHAPPGYTGAPIPLAEIGTDPRLGRSPTRGTGTYRVPSLRGVSTRGPLLHDGTLPSTAALFDQARLTPGYPTLHGSGPVPGHRFGLDLDPQDRADLLAFLETL